MPPPSACEARIPGFTTALLNGREQVSTGDNRSVEFDQYPSELMSSVLVYKTPDSQLAAQGLAGTIDLRTIRPIDYGKSAIAVNFRGEQNSNGNLGANSDDSGYRASFSFVDQFMEGASASPSATRTSTPRWRRAASAPTSPGTPRAGATSCSTARAATADACQNNPGVAPGQFRDRRHEGPRGHGLDRARRLHGDAGSSRPGGA